MRISPLAEIVIRDLDDLRKSASGLTKIWAIGEGAYPPRPWYIVFERFLKDRYKTYEKSRRRLYTLLQLDRWSNLQQTMALWEAVKIAYGRDFFDNLQEQKENEMSRLTQNVRLFMKKIGEVLLEYKNLFGLESDGAPVRPEAEVYMTQILSHPSEEYRSYSERYEDMAEDVSKRITNLKAIREKTLEVFRRTSPELCVRIVRTEEQLFATIRLTDQQERLESVDLRLIDSVLKSVCTHNPPCYEEGANSRDPAAFAKQVLACPDVAEILGTESSRRKRDVRILLVNHLAVDALIDFYCNYYIPLKHRKAFEGREDFRTFQQETIDEHASSLASELEG